MPSLNHKLSKLADEYQHSKNSPAYRDLKLKYKALKAANKELVQLLTHALSARIEPQKCKKHRKQFSQLNEPGCITEETTTFDPEECSNVTPPEPDPVQYKVYEPTSEESPTSEDEESVTEDFDEMEEPDVDIQTQIREELEAESVAVSENLEIVVEEEVVEEEVVEEEVVEEEVVEEEEEEVVEEEEEEVVEEEEEEDEDAGVYEIEVKGKRYYTTNEKDGIVYALLEDDEVGDEIGKFVNGKLVLNK